MWIGWVPEMAELFSLVAADWTPPTQVKAHRAKVHTTIVARFTTPAGHTTTAKVRISRAGPGEVWIHDEGLSLTFKVGGHC